MNNYFFFFLIFKFFIFEKKKPTTHNMIWIVSLKDLWYDFDFQENIQNKVSEAV